MNYELLFLEQRTKSKEQRQFYLRLYYFSRHSERSEESRLFQ